MLVRALYAFTATSGNELSIHAAERLALIEGGYNSETGSCWGDSGWVRVASLDGRREGFVPASYVLLDQDDDVDRQLRLLKAQREAEQAELMLIAQETAAVGAAREAAAAKARTAKRAAIRRNATAAKVEAKVAAVKAAAAAAAAAAAQAEVDALDQATVLCGGETGGGPSEASQAAEAPGDYDSSGACSQGSVPTVTAPPAAATAVLTRELTNRELKELCARHGISTSSALERADLIALAQPCLPALDPTPAAAAAPAPAPAPAAFTPHLVVPSCAAAQPCDGQAVARPVFQKGSPQDAHLRKARLQVEAYFQTQPAPEKKLGTSADSGAEGPSKRLKTVASPLPGRTTDAVRLPHTPPGPTRPHPAPPHSQKRRSLVFRAG